MLIILEAENTRLKKRLDRVEATCERLSILSMGRDLVFRGIPETKDENILEKVRSFVSTDIECDVEIVQAWRAGKGSPRTVMAQVRDPESRTELLACCSNLKDKQSDISVSEALPTVTNERRISQLAAFKEKRNELGSKRVKLRQDKLTVDKKVISPQFEKKCSYTQNCRVRHATPPVDGH